MLFKNSRIAHSKAQLAGNGGPLANSCNAAVSDLGASRRASHNIHTNLTIVNVRFLARLNVQAIRYTALERVFSQHTYIACLCSGAA